MINRHGIISKFGGSNLRSHRLQILLLILFPLLALSLSCVLVDAKLKTPTPMLATKYVPAGFLKSDCAIPGVTFQDMTIDYITDGYYDGPYLVCSSSSEGTHNLSVHYYISISAIKTKILGEEYDKIQANIQGFVDQSSEWNADPDLPPSARDTISFIRNDNDGYVFMITGEANVQNCFHGSGYGVEKVNGKYLVQIQFQSCELTDTEAYTNVLKSLESAALSAIQRVEAESDLRKVFKICDPH